MSLKISKSEHSKLTSILKYKNRSVIDRFRSEHGIGPKESNIIFKDLIYFLWLSDWSHRYNKKHKNQNTFIGIKGPLLIVDEMWHTFVLYTQSYEEFCNKYFKKYIGHYPGPSYIEFMRKKHKPQKNGKDQVWERQKQITKELLGKKVYDRWYKTYKKYSLIRIKELQLRAAIKKENGTLK